MDINRILEAHSLWLAGEGGERANLRHANLQGANLRDADLQGANLRDANLRYANLQGANLRHANLQGANLQGANLRDADLQGANLRLANLQGANLRYANLWGADLQGVRGDGSAVRSLHVGGYDIAYTTERLQIGCQNHGLPSWWQFSDAEILEMDGRTALKWWRQWKAVLKSVIETSQGGPDAT